MDGNVLLTTQQFMKTVTRKHERQKQEVEMFLKWKTQSRKRQHLLEMDDEHEEVAILSLCAVTIKKPRKMQDKNEARDKIRNKLEKSRLG